tara:strand:+ start:301 stop:1014 length:714 start_codon:yes stop_codon:yes gene_type:complete
MNEIISASMFFNEELIKSLCDDMDDTNESKDETCLITGEKLNDDHLTLECKHKFNYAPMFEEVVSQKKPTQLETTRLKKNQIKCPYCRKVQSGVLPYREGDKKYISINWPPEAVYKSNFCSAILKTGKRKNEKCGKSCHNKICNRHQKLQEKRDLKNKEKASLKNNNPKCLAIYSSGMKKGQQCNAKCKWQNILGSQHYCSRHLNKLWKTTNFKQKDWVNISNNKIIQNPTNTVQSI